MYSPSYGFLVVRIKLRRHFQHLNPRSHLETRLACPPPDLFRLLLYQIDTVAFLLRPVSSINYHRAMRLDVERFEKAHRVEDRLLSESEDFWALGGRTTLEA